MTEADKEMAAQVHDLALALYRYYTYGEDSDLIQGADKKFPVVPLVIVILLLAAAVAAVIAVKRRRSH